MRARLDNLAAGLSAEQIVAEYLSLAVDDIRAAEAYAAQVGETTNKSDEPGGRGPLSACQAGAARSSRQAELSKIPATRTVAFVGTGECEIGDHRGFLGSLLQQGCHSRSESLRPPFDGLKALLCRGVVRRRRRQPPKQLGGLA